MILGAVLALGLGTGVAFGGGVLYGRNTAPQQKTASASGGSATAAGGAAAAPGGAGGTGAAGGTPGAGQQARGAAPIAGAIESVSGSTLNVRTVQGASVPVAFSNDTRMTSTQSATISDLKPGSVVVVTGQTDANGTVNATAITIQSSTPPGITPGSPGASPGARGATGAGGVRPGGGPQGTPSAPGTPAQ
jgi:hypothetical protein